MDPVKSVMAFSAALTLPALTSVSACTRDELPVAEEVCIGQYGPCARLADGRVACWGGSDAFVFDADAVRLDCAAPVHKQLCVEDSSRQFGCWAADAEHATDAALSVPPDDVLPLERWWLGKWWYGGGCGFGADGVMTCWPPDRSDSGAPENLAEYPVQWVSFTHPCMLLVDADGTLHSRYETEDCTTLEEPKYYESPHDAHGLDEVPAGSNWRSVAGGMYHACALDDQGQATCWGRYVNEEEQAPTNLRFTTLTAGNQVTCGITTLGTIHCWGGERAYDKYSYSNDWIHDDVPMSTGWVDITMSEDYACAIDVDGRVTCFGNFWPDTVIEDALQNPVDEPPTDDGTG